MTQKQQQEAWHNTCVMLMGGVRENLDAKIDTLSMASYAWKTPEECKALRARKDALRGARAKLARLTPVHWEQFLMHTKNWTGELRVDFVEVTTVGGDRNYMEVLWEQI